MTAGGAFGRIPGIDYVKMPGDVFDSIMTHDSQGQQDKLFGAYCREFMTGNPGKLPKSIAPHFALIKSVADRIKAGILTGSIRHGRGAKHVENPVETPREVGEKSASRRGVVGEKSGRSLEEVGISSTRSHEIPSDLPADMLKTPPTSPNTLYTNIYTDIYRDPRTDAARAVPHPRPTAEEWQRHADEIGPEGFAANAGELYTILEGRGFRDGDGKPIRDWKAYAQAVAKRYYG